MAQSEFRLSPQEDWIFGVKMRGSVLSFGPSGSEVAVASIACVVMGGIGALMAFSSSPGATINGYQVKNPTAMLVLAAVTIAYAAGSLVLPTATELKIQALSRYRNHVTGLLSDAPTVGPALLEYDAASRWVIVWSLGSCLSLWLLVSWAAGTLVSPLLLIVGVVISVYKIAQHRHIG